MTKKNRKVRRLRELHPEIDIRIFYQRDYLNLLVKYGLEPPSQLADGGADTDGHSLEVAPGLDLSRPPAAVRRPA